MAVRLKHLVYEGIVPGCGVRPCRPCIALKSHLCGLLVHFETTSRPTPLMGTGVNYDTFYAIFQAHINSLDVPCRGRRSPQGHWQEIPQTGRYGCRPILC